MELTYIHYYIRVKKGLPYSPENYTQYFVITYKGKE